MNNSENIKKFKTLIFVKASLISLYLALTIPITYFSINELKFISIVIFLLGLFLIISITNDYVITSDNSISYNLTIDAKKSLNVVSRDSKGQAQTYKAEVTVSLTAKNDNQVIKKDFIMSNNYNSESRVTRLKEIENKIINNLSSIIADQIVLFLMNE